MKLRPAGLADKQPWVGILALVQIITDSIPRVFSKGTINISIGFRNLDPEGSDYLSIAINQLVPPESDKIAHTQPGGSHQL
jgi:hypothetical protein